MFVYILVILFILFLQYRLANLSYIEKRRWDEKRYLKIVCLILLFLAAFRGATVGADTLGYWQEYGTLSEVSFSDIFDRFSDYPGYYILAKICSLLHLPVYVLFGLVEGLYIYAIYKFVDRYSTDKLYSILCFTVLDLYAFSLAGLKQTMAMSFVLLYYMDLEDRKLIRAVILAVFAYYCHHVSLIFLAGVALYIMRNLRFYYVYLAVIVAIVFLGTQFIWNGMLSLLENDHYSELYQQDKGYSSSSMIIYGVLLGILLLFSRRYRIYKPEESRIMLGMSTYAFVFQSFSFVSSTAFRLSYFFLPYMIVAFPNDFNFINDATIRKNVKFIVELILIFVFIYINRNGGSIVPYRFFWQG